MAFDFHSEWESKTGYNTPLYSNHKDYTSIYDSVQYWIDRVGSKRNLLYLTFAFFGQEYSSQHANVNSHGSHIGKTPYYKICHKLRYNGWTTGYDIVFKSAFAHGEEYWVSYDNLESIKDKVEFLVNNRLGGAAIWDISFDDLSECSFFFIFGSFFASFFGSFFFVHFLSSFFG